MAKYENYEIQLEAISEWLKCRVLQDGISLWKFEIMASQDKPYWDAWVDKYMGWGPWLDPNQWEEFEETHGVPFLERGITEPYEALNYLSKHFDNYIEEQQRKDYENYEFPYSEII